MDSKYPHQQQPMPMPQPMAQPPPYDNQTNFSQPGFQTGQAAEVHYHHHHVQSPHHHPIIVDQPTTVVVAANVGPEPTMTQCPSCRSTIVTRMEYEPSTRTHLFAALLCLFGCWLCCCLPYCMDSCRNGNHYCPSCGAYIGTYHS